MVRIDGLKLLMPSVTIALLVFGGRAEAQASSYLDYEGLTRELRSLTDGSGAARLVSLGRSHEGRDIWMVEIGDRSAGSLAERPGVLVVGNLTGDHVVGSANALGIIRHLLTADDAQVVLADQVVYVVPRLNPDGAEAMFGRVKQARRRNARPFDDDNDGRVDEDPGEDLNGDGVITMMRVPDPLGAYIIDPDDPRLMKEADPAEGESGAYTLYWEGRDSDGDGFLNEDGAGGVDLDRNFQHAYDYWQRDVGPHMVSEPESRALMDFVVAHRNIAAILTFGHSDNLVVPPDARGALAEARTLDLVDFADASNADIFERGVFSAGGGGGGGFGFFFFGGGGLQLRGAQPGRDNDPDSGRRPAMTVNAADRSYFEAVSEAYREATGIERVGVNREAAGAFFQFGYFQFGVPAFSTQGWGLPEGDDASEPEGEASEATERRPGSGRPAGTAGRQGGRAGVNGGDGFDATLLQAMDDAGIDVFVEWTPFSHPDLGEVEIGGFRPYRPTNPPEEELADLGRRHGLFVVRLASMLPSVSIVDTEVTNHGGGVFTVTAEIQNAGFFPTALRHGVVSRSVQPTTVQIQVPPEAVLTGAPKTARVQRLEGSGAREKFTWVIRGREGSSVEIRVRSQKGGSDAATVTLR